MIFKQLYINSSLSHFYEVTKLIQHMPIIMRNLLIFLTLVDEMVQELETFLKGSQVFLTNLFTFLFLQ